MVKFWNTCEQQQVPEIITVGALRRGLIYSGACEVPRKSLPKSNYFTVQGLTERVFADHAVGFVVPQVMPHL